MRYRHYSELIVRLQAAMRVELRRLDKERKEQDEVVENLHDKIASLTVRGYGPRTDLLSAST